MLARRLPQQAGAAAPAGRWRPSRGVLRLASPARAPRTSARPLMSSSPSPLTPGGGRRGAALPVVSALKNDNHDQSPTTVPADPPPPLHVPLGLVLFSSWAMSAWAWFTAADAAAAAAPSLLAPSDAALLGALMGASIGGAFAALNRYARRSLWRAPARRLRVVVTGGTRGLGKALARELLAAGDAVAITGRGEEAIAKALRELPAEAVALLRASGQDDDWVDDAFTESEMRRRLAGFVCDVAADDGGASVDAALQGAAAFFATGGGGGGGGGADASNSTSPGFDVLICNAGASGGAKALFFEEEEEEKEEEGQKDDADRSGEPARLRSVVRTNLLGALRCAKAGLSHLSAANDGGTSSARPGHLFFMDGAGADGSATPMYSAYGSTKAALPQLARSLRAELKDAAALSSSSSSSSSTSSSSSSTVGIHTLSPGMMLTDLLLDGSPPAVRALVFNALCEQPETVAAFLAPRVRSAVARGLDGTYPKFLTPLSAAVRFASLPMRTGSGGRGRFFDSEGNPTFLEEHERILGKGARATARARRSAGVASRWAPLRAAYSASLLACAVALASALGPVGNVGAGAVDTAEAAQVEQRVVVADEAAAVVAAAADEAPPPL